MLQLLLDQLAVTPTSGRLMARELPNNQQVLVGVLHFPAAFQPKEGALYMALYSAEGKFNVIPSVIESDYPQECGGSMEGVLRSDCWRKTNMPGTLTVRFVEAFPESNGWTLYGPSNQMLFPPSSYHRGHAFMEVTNGLVQPLPPVDGVHGISASQLLNRHVIWPDANGVLHEMPTNEARWRQAFYDHSVLQARLGAGEITQDEFNKAVLADPKVFQLRSFSRDERYLQYLVELRAAGGIQLQRPLTVPERDARDEMASAILRNMVAKQRTSEIEGLAKSLNL
jgi:hypothetical protein